MSNRLTRGIRPAIALLVAFAAAVLLMPAAATATPDSPDSPTDEPNIASVQKRLGELALQNTQLVEKYDQAKQDVTDKQAAATKAAQAAQRAAAAFAAGRTRLAKTVAAQYESGSFSATGALLESKSNEGYLEKLTTLRMLANHTSGVVARLDKAQQKADSAQEKAKKLLASAKHKRSELAKQKQKVTAQIAKYTDLLERLNAEQRRAYERARLQMAQTSSQQQQQSSPEKTVKQIKNAPAVHASSAAAQTAVKFALAQVGKPYVFGADGPSSYDCSGLTMSAWAAAGVSLPHSALRQYNYGTHVSFNELQPGDLLFFYQPIGHVAIYVGDGMMVSAPQPGESVEVIPANAFGSDYVGATRLVS